MSAVDETTTSSTSFNHHTQDRRILVLRAVNFQPRTQITMDRLTQLQDTLDDVCDLCDKPPSNIGH